MRNVINPNPTLGTTTIPKIKLDWKCRDDTPQILAGLQTIFITLGLWEKIRAILSEVLPQSTSGKGPADPKRGRPGMDQWTIFVLGCLRLGLGVDYDRIHDLVNKHVSIREMLGFDDWLDHGKEIQFPLQTLKDNLRLFTPELLDRINQVVSAHGLALKNKLAADETPVIHARCDSFVVETDVHFPTDINLLWDAMRKCLELAGKLCAKLESSEWRQFKYQLRLLKKAYRLVQKAKHSTSKDPKKIEAKEQKTRQAHEQYLARAKALIERIEATIAKGGQIDSHKKIIDEIASYIVHAKRQIDQIERRVLQSETIPHSEKVFSLFEPHTEMIRKGKLGKPMEFGVRVAVVADQGGFVRHHQVMANKTDDAVAVSIIEETIERTGPLQSVSMDKGFHSPANQAALGELVEFVVLPKKGKLNAKEKERESSSEFVNLRHQHSAVESDINALGVHGLDRCRDHGFEGFQRYVAMAVVARNVQHLGALVLQNKAELERRRRRRKKAA